MINMIGCIKEHIINSFVLSFPNFESKNFKSSNKVDKLKKK